MLKRRTTRRKTRRRQRGGILPLAVLIPAAVAVGKATALGGVSGAAGYGVKRGLKAALQRKKPKRAATPAQKRRLRRAQLRGNPGSQVARLISRRAHCSKVNNETITASHKEKEKTKGSRNPGNSWVRRQDGLQTQKG